MKHEQALRSLASLLTVTDRQGTTEKQGEKSDLNTEKDPKRRRRSRNGEKDGESIRSSVANDDRVDAESVEETAGHVLGISRKEERKIVVKIVRDDGRNSGHGGHMQDGDYVKIKEDERAEKSAKDYGAQGSSRRGGSQLSTDASSPVLHGFLSSVSCNGVVCTLPSLSILPTTPSQQLQQSDDKITAISNREEPAERNPLPKQPQDQQQKWRRTKRKDVPVELIKEKCDESISKAVLRNLIKKGNPFPPQGSYNKGKKKLQKRRRSSHRSSITARNNMAAAAAAAAAAFDDEDGDDALALASPQPPPRATPPTKTEQMISNLAHPLHYFVSSTSSDIATAPHLLNANLGHSMQSLIDDRIKYYLTKLIRKSIIKEKGFINSHASRILAHDIGCFDLSNQGSMGFVERVKNQSFFDGPVVLKGCVTSFNIPKDADPKITSRDIPCGADEDDDFDEEQPAASPSSEDKNSIKVKNEHENPQHHRENNNNNIDEDPYASNKSSKKRNITPKSTIINNHITNSTQCNKSKIEKSEDSPRKTIVHYEEDDADAAGRGSQPSHATAATATRNSPAISLGSNNLSDNDNKSTIEKTKEEATNIARDIENSNDDAGANSDSPSHDVSSDSKNIRANRTIMEFVMPLTFAAIVDVEIGIAGRKSNAHFVSLEFGAPGSIMGTFKGSSPNCLLKSATINLDTTSLFNSMIHQAKLAIRKVMTMVGPVDKKPSELGYLLASKPITEYNSLLNRQNSTTTSNGTSMGQPAAGRIQLTSSPQQSSTVAYSDPAHAEEMIRRASLASTGNSGGLGLPTTFTEVAMADRRRRSSLLSTNSRRESMASTASVQQRASFTAAPPGSTRALGEGSSCAKSEHAEEMIRRASMMSSMAVDGSTRCREETEASFTSGSCPKAARAEEIIRRNSAMSGDPDDNSTTKELCGSCPKARQAELLLRRASMVSSLDGDEEDDVDGAAAGSFSAEKVEKLTNLRRSSVASNISQESSLAGSKRRLSTTLNDLDEGEKPSTKPGSKPSRRASTQSSMPAHLNNIPTKLWNLPAKSRRVSESVVQSSLEIARLRGDVSSVGCGDTTVNSVLKDGFTSTLNSKTLKTLSMSNTPSSGMFGDNGLLQSGGAQMPGVATVGGSMQVSDQTLTSSLPMRRRSSGGLLQPSGAQMAAAAVAASASESALTTAGNMRNSGLFQPGTAPIETPEQVAATGLAVRRRSSRAQMAAAAAAVAASVAENSVPEGTPASMLGCGLLQQNMAEQVATMQAQKIAHLGMMGAMGGLAGATAGSGLSQSNTAVLQQLQAVQVQAQVQQQVQAAQVAAAVRRNSYRRVSFDREALGPLLAAFADEQEEGGP